MSWRELDNEALRVALLDKFTLLIDPFDDAAIAGGWEPGAYCPVGAIDAMVRRRCDPDIAQVIENALASS